MVSRLSNEPVIHGKMTVTKSVFKMTDKVKPQRSNQNYKTSQGFRVQNLYCGGRLSSIKIHSLLIGLEGTVNEISDLVLYLYLLLLKE